MRPDTSHLPRATPVVIHDTIRLRTVDTLQFVDLTETLVQRIRLARLQDGIVNVQTRHTTTAVVVNENEPQLLEDLKEKLRCWAPRHARYRHDDLRVRTVNLTAEERANGHAHARALILGTSETVNVVRGKIQLGRWQRVFLVELDGPLARTVSIAMLGMAGESTGGPAALPQPRRASAGAA